MAMMEYLVLMDFSIHSFKDLREYSAIGDKTSRIEIKMNDERKGYGEKESERMVN